MLKIICKIYVVAYKVYDQVELSEILVLFFTALILFISIEWFDYFIEVL